MAADLRLIISYGYSSRFKFPHGEKAVWGSFDSRGGGKRLRIKTSLATGINLIKK